MAEQANVVLPLKHPGIKFSTFAADKKPLASVEPRRHFLLLWCL